MPVRAIVAGHVDKPALGPKPLRALIDTLWALEVIDWQLPSAIRGERVSIAPLPPFERKVEFGVTLDEFGWAEGGELVLLNRNKRRRGIEWGELQGTVRRDPVNYTDNAGTTQMREQMRRINSWLAAADIDFIDDGQLPRGCPNRGSVSCAVTSSFWQTKPSHAFDQSGRLSGGFWQPLKKERRQNIRVDGEPVATLDFGSMFTRLAYARLGVQSPEGDLSLSPERELVAGSMAMNTMFFNSGRRMAWPKELGVGVGDEDAARAGEPPAADFEARLPEGWTVRRTRASDLATPPGTGWTVRSRDRVPPDA